MVRPEVCSKRDSAQCILKKKVIKLVRLHKSVCETTHLTFLAQCIKLDLPSFYYPPLYQHAMWDFFVGHGLTTEEEDGPEFW